MKGINYLFLFTPTSLNYYVIKINKNYFIYFKAKNFKINLLLYYILIKNIFLIRTKPLSINLNSIIYTWVNFIVKKIKFKHKISWVYFFRKNLNFIKISTNLSHFRVLINNAIKFKRKKKHLSMHTLVVWGLNLNFINLLLKFIISSLPFNQYTQNGFRLARCSFKKKIGKISKYSSLKSKIF